MREDVIEVFRPRSRTASLLLVAPQVFISKIKLKIRDADICATLWLDKRHLCYTVIVNLAFVSTFAHQRSLLTQTPADVSLCLWETLFWNNSPDPVECNPVVCKYFSIMKFCCCVTFTRSPATRETRGNLDQAGGLPCTVWERDQIGCAANKRAIHWLLPSSPQPTFCCPALFMLNPKWLLAPYLYALHSVW